MSLIYFVNFPNLNSFKKKLIGGHYKIEFKDYQIITPCNLDLSLIHI